MTIIVEKVIFSKMVPQIFLIVIGVLTRIAEAKDEPINYEIPEDLKAGTFIGNVKFDAGLDKKHSLDVLSELK